MARYLAELIPMVRETTVTRRMEEGEEPDCWNVWVRDCGEGRSWDSDAIESDEWEEVLDVDFETYEEAENFLDNVCEMAGGPKACAPYYE